MCTCIELQTKNHYFGRNLDLEYRFAEKVVITPRKYAFSLKNGASFHTKYALMGMAAVAGEYPLYAEAANEEGLSMAGLYFPGNACFFEEKPSALNLAPYELIPYFLGQYATIAAIRGELERLNITNVPFAANLPVTQLHWMVSDGKECIVIEQMQEGLRIYENPIGVLTNNPTFPYHLENIRNYMNLTPHYAENTFSPKVSLVPYGQGIGAVGLPGDASPASRFVRAAFHKLNSVCSEEEESSVAQFFHILDSVAMVRGAVVTREGKNDITTYSCCMNTDQGIYYYKTYGNNQLTAVRMTEGLKDRKELSVFELRETQNILYENEKEKEV